MNSFTEENYLKAIYKLAEQDGGVAITTNAIADKVATKAASVTDMLKKLSDKKLINYKKYQGVTLTVLGKKVAVNIIRKHRLWEFFLVEKLRFKWDEVHDIAEQLEHIRSEELIEKLDVFLGSPKVDPHGDPIPDVNGQFSEQKSQLLSALDPGQKGIMTGVVDHSPTFLQHLDKLGINLGNEIRLNEVIDYDKSAHITLNRKQKLFLSSEVAKNILVLIK